MTEVPSTSEISRTVGEALVTSPVLPLLLVERDGRVTFANAAAVRAFGAGALEGSNILDRVLPADRSLLEGLLEGEGYREPESVRVAGDGGVILRRLSLGTVGRTASHGTLLLGADGEGETGPGAASADRRVARLAERAGKIAHGLNNSLSTITAFSDLLLADAEPESSLAEDLAEVKRAALRAAELVRGLEELDGD